MPGLLGYGLAIIGVFYILGTPNHPKFFFFFFFIEYRAAQFAYYIFAYAGLVSVGEIMLGTFVEKYCQIEWWNYSSLPLHIDKYTSLFTSITFGLMITIFMNSLFFSIMKWATHISTLFFQTVVMLLFILLIADFIHEAEYMIKNKRINRIWKIDISTKGVFKKANQSSKC